MSFATIPRGFFAANETLNLMGPRVLTQLVSEAANNQQTNLAISADKYSRLASLPVAEARSAINAVMFILRSTANVSGSDELIKVLHKHTDLGPNALKIFNEHALIQGVKTKKKTMKLDRLVGIDWRLAVAVSSSKCTDMRSPNISVDIKIAASAGQIETHSLEMTLPEFQDFIKAFEDMSLQLDAV